MLKFCAAIGVPLLLASLPAIAEPVSQADLDAAFAQARSVAGAAVDQAVTAQAELATAQQQIAADAATIKADAAHILQMQSDAAARDALVSKLRAIAPAPAATLTASPAAINLGETSTLSLVTVNTETCTPAGWDILNPVVTPQATATYKIDCTGFNGATVSASADVIVTPTPPPTPDPTPAPPESQAQVVYGPHPSDGVIVGTDLVSMKGEYVFPAVVEGQRLTGTVTISPVVTVSGTQTPASDQSIYANVSKRLVLNGVPQDGWTIDTTKYPDGTYALGVQVMGPVAGLVSGSRVVVINNSGKPYTSKMSQTVVQANTGSWHNNSLAFGNVNILDPAPAPIGHRHDLHPLPTDADRARMATDPVWWLEGLNHQGTGLYISYPLLVKNQWGDYFVRQWTPQAYEHSLDSSPIVAQAPAFDGPRGVNMLSPFATLVPSPHVFANGMTGWVGVDIAGRVVDVEISGQVTTIFGPRSVAGVVQTDPWLWLRNGVPFTLEQRVAAGEKEYVGTGPFLKVPQDIAVVDDDVLLIADTGANQVSRLSRSAGKIVSVNPAPGVTSVWYGLGSEWWVTKNTLWRDGAAVATVPDAFTVRGDPVRGVVYVLADSLAVSEFDPSTGAVVQRVAGRGVHIPFVFMAVDHKGNIGPRGRVYFAGVLSFDNKYIHYIDPDAGVWTDTTWLPKFANFDNGYGSKQVNNDQWGHYLWGFTIHDAEAVWVSTGIANSSWKIAVAHLGEQPIPDPPSSDLALYGRGERLVAIGLRDVAVGMEAFFSHYGAGGLGYTVDLPTLRDGTIADFRAYFDPLLPASYSEYDRKAVATYMRYQRSRSHFPHHP